jgi:hypothetical protein
VVELAVCRYTRVVFFSGGEIVVAVSGRSFDEYVREEILGETVTFEVNEEGAVTCVLQHSNWSVKVR